MAVSPASPDDAVEIIGPGVGREPLILTCEHASRRVPRPLRSSAADREILASHWGYDIGAATVTREVVRRTGSLALLARFSRLVCDANRHAEDATWIRREVEGQVLSFNARVDAAEIGRRRRRYYEPYHHAVDEVLRRRLAAGGDVLLLSVHSFTPVFGEDRRDMEVGVLFNDHAAVAQRLERALAATGLRAALNEPYSGRQGMMFAAQRHGTIHNVVYLEIELRQDLLATPAQARRMGAALADCLQQLRVRHRERPARGG